MLVLTTSYPRHRADTAGVFVEDAVEHLRAAGVEVSVVAPSSFRHYGIAYGDGIANNLRAEKWRVLLLPLFLVSFARAARRAAAGADVVHAHWLPSGIAGLATRKPLVVQLWGSDVELAKRLPWLFRPILRRARIVICASSALAADAKALGARDVRMIPSGVDVPESRRRSRGAATRPLRRAPVGGKGRPRSGGRRGGPSARRRRRRPSARPLPAGGRLRSARRSWGPYYERASVVVVPSRREGYGVVAREAMAYGRAVVATNVGGLPDAVEDGVTGILVEPRDPAALRLALERLLGDEDLREKLGIRSRAAVLDGMSWGASTEATEAAYRSAIRAPGAAGG